MKTSTKLYLVSLPLTLAGVVLSLLGDREFRREHEAKTWDDAVKETDSDTGVSGK